MRGVCDHGKRTTRPSLRSRSLFPRPVGSIVFESRVALPSTLHWDEHREGELGVISCVEVEARNQQQQRGTGADGASKVGANDLRRLIVSG
jgi:hypothetical protein